MTNRVFTYFEPLFPSTLEQEKKLLRKWKRNWRLAGWEPYVIHRDATEGNPLLARFSIAVASLPTVNDKSYEMACWRRWLAYQWVAPVFGPSLYIDYDVAATEPIPRPEAPCWLGLGYDSSCYADHRMLDKIIELMMTRAPEGTIEVNGRPHCSDMTLLNKLGHEIAPSLGICSLYPERNQLVHINNESVITHGKGRNRLSIFQEVAAQLKP
jgi:hypothetical protein